MNTIDMELERLESDMRSAAMSAFAFGKQEAGRAYKVAAERIAVTRALVDRALVPTAWRFVHPDGKVAVYAEGEVPQNPNPPPPEGWLVEQLYSIRPLAEVLPPVTLKTDPNSTNSVGPQ